MIRRAFKEGEIDADEAKRKRQRVKLKALGRPGHIKRFEELPESLQDLVERSFALHDRIVKLDRAVTTAEVVPDSGDLDELPVSNPVAAQMNMLRQAFGN